MIYTVTLNPAVDKAVVIPGFAPGQVNRAAQLRTDVGGKGINVSKCLKALGMPSRPALLAAGATGKGILSWLREEGYAPLTVWAEGNTRTNTKILDPETGTNTDINEPGPTVTAEELLTLRETLARHLRPGDLVVLSGSLPPGVPAGAYQDWTRRFHDLGAAVFLDGEGEALRRGIQAGPELVKPNRRELEGLAGRPLPALPEVEAAARQLLQLGVGQAAVSLGEEGALFVLPEESWYASPLPAPVRNTVGAGDAMVAALAFAHVRGLDQKTGFRLAAAMGTASVALPGTQAPEYGRAAALMEQISLRRL